MYGIQKNYREGVQSNYAASLYSKEHSPLHCFVAVLIHTLTHLNVVGHPEKIKWLSKVLN